MPIANNYFINEGNKLGYVDTTFDEDVNLQSMKLVAAADLTKGRVVEIASFDAATGSCKVQHATAKSAKMIGVAMFDYKAGEECAVETEGLFKLVASGAITAGDKVTAAADGKLAKATAAAASAPGDPTCGIALNTTAADGDWVYVKFSI